MAGVAFVFWPAALVVAGAALIAASWGWSVEHLLPRPARLDTYADLIPSTARVGPPMTRDNSLTSSVKWACQRLRADLVSTTPLDVSKQTVNGVATTMPTPPVLSMPDGRMDVTEWLYGSPVRPRRRR